MYCKAKKNFGAIQNFLKISIFENLHHKKSLKGEISIDADSGPPRHVLWCCSGICHQVLTFFQIGCGHTVVCKVVVSYHFSFVTITKWWSSFSDTFVCLKNLKQNSKEQLTTKNYFVWLTPWFKLCNIHNIFFISLKNRMANFAMRKAIFV